MRQIDPLLSLTWTTLCDTRSTIRWAIRSIYKDIVPIERYPLFFDGNLVPNMSLASAADSYSYRPKFAGKRFKSISLIALELSYILMGPDGKILPSDLSATVM